MPTSVIRAFGYRLCCIIKQYLMLTCLCFGLPIIISISLIGNNLVFEGADIEEDVAFIPESRDLSNIMASSPKISIVGVSPYNDAVRHLMTAAVLYLSVEPTLVFENDSQNLSKFFLKNSEESDVSEFIFGIEISELSESKLSYKLRSSADTNWYLGETFPKLMSPGPAENGKMYLSTGFLSLQVAINQAYATSYLKLQISNWVVQEFPYPQYISVVNFADLKIVLLACLQLYGVSLVLCLIGAVIIEEKSSGIRELLKLNGIGIWMIYTFWFFVMGVIATYSAVVITMSWRVSLYETTPVLPNCDSFLLFTTLFILFWSNVCFIGFASSLIDSLKFGFICLLLFTIFIPLICLRLVPHNSITLMCLATLLPNVAINHIIWAFVLYEGIGQRMEFSNSFNPVFFESSDVLPIGYCLVIMLVSMLIYFLLMLYIGEIKPRPYGHAEPCCFICNRILRSGKQWPVPPEEEGDKYKSNVVHEFIKDKKPVGLKIVNLKKRFGRVSAVNDLSMTIYENEITAVLGHNGAGKSTFFNIICGVFSPTSGNVYTQDYNIFSGDNLRIFRKQLGYCQQTNLLLGNLKVEQHLIFFGVARGQSTREAQEKSIYWMKKFGMYEYRKRLVYKLSEGMKRKLCICIALIGDPRYLLLDEPTAGLDPESRRDIWDVLLLLRGDRTIIISTHDMEEANVLSDRIAIIANGNLKCFGSPTFLKQHYGFGYQLEITKKKLEPNPLKFVQRFVPSARLINRTDTSISISLPAKDIEKFPNLFTELDAQYGLDRYSLSCTNTESVFLKVQEDEGVKITVDDANIPTMDSQSSQVNRPFQQLLVFMEKRLLCALFHWLYFFIFIVVVPFVVIFVIILLAESIVRVSSIENYVLDLSFYKNSIAFVARREDDKVADGFESLVTASGSRFQKVPSGTSIVDALLTAGETDLFNYRLKMVVALDSTNTPNVLYSATAYHSFPIGVGLLFNSLLQHANSRARIVTYNFPYERESKETGCSTELVVASSLLIFQWVAFYAIAVLLTVAIFMIFPLMERKGGIKHLQIMTGAQPVFYWAAIFTVDVAIFSISVAVTMLMLFIFDHHRLYTPTVILEALFLVTVLFGLSAITFGYICSYFFDTVTSGIIFYCLANLGAAVASLLLFSSETSWLSYILNIFPWLPFVSCIRKIISLVSVTTLCTQCAVGDERSSCLNIMDSNLASLDMKMELIYMAVIGPVCLFLILLNDYGFFRLIIAPVERVLFGKIKPSAEPLNPDVVIEKENVSKAVDQQESPGSQPSLIFLCDNLGKKFSSSFVAVQDVSFVLNRRECFGLLGVNGAGKSTTFKMLTGMLIPTRGDAVIESFSLASCRRQYLKRLGYCPQQDALLPELSAREHLSLFGFLRGIPSSELGDIVQKWIDALDMSAICDRPCGNYSGGNKRKLCTAMAIIGDPSVILLDEPTAGVDAVVKGKIRSILKHTRDTIGQSIIVTNHSMGECESLCDRVAIMVDGSIKCIGTVSYLKNRYSRGYLLTIKLIYASTMDDLKLIAKITKKRFGTFSSLEDTQHGLLTFVIDSKIVSLNSLFTFMNDFKSRQQKIEDFTVESISLDQAFLSFGKRAG